MNAIVERLPRMLGGRRAAEAAQPAPASAPVRYVADEFDATREVYEVLSRFTEAEQTRIVEAAMRRINDERYHRRQQEDQR